MTLSGFAKTIAAPAVFHGLACLENMVSRRPWKLKWSPTFVVAPPRSGTTFLRQLVAWGIPTSFFSNFMVSSHAKLGRPLPYVTGRIASLIGLPESLKACKSSHSYTRGWGAPAEAERVWEYGFGSQYDAVSPEDLGESQRAAIYQLVAATERAFDRPFVQKSTVLSVRIRALAAIFPDALFVRLLRDPLDVAQSLFIARRKHIVWIGARPLESRNVGGKSILEQVCDQVYFTEKHITRERLMTDDDRWLSVSYADACAEPARELSRVVRFMSDHGAPATIARAPLPSYECSQGRKVDQATYDAMASYLARLAESDGNLVRCCAHD